MNNLRFAIRQLRKNPGFTAVAVCSLAIALGLAVATFATVNAYLRMLPYPTAARVYHVMYAPPGPYEPRGMTAIDWAALNDVVEDTITPASATFYVMDGGSVKTLRALRAPPGFLRGLGVRPATGRAFAPEEYREGAERVAMIGYEMWQDRFGSDPQAVGGSFRVSQDEAAGNTDTFRVVGVLPPRFWFGRDSSARVDVLTPLRTPVRTYMVRLREGVPVAHAERRITEAARVVGSDFRPGWAGVRLESVRDRYVATLRPVLNRVSIAVGIVLMLVCANVAVLTLLRGMRRQKEMAVRVALGAGPRHVLRIFLTETFLICGIASAAGFALAWMALRVLTPLIETQLGKPSPGGPATIQLDATGVMIAGAVSGMIALSLALLPWFGPSRQRLGAMLRSQQTNSADGPRMRRIRDSLIAFEVAGAVVLLAGCGMMIRSTVNLLNTELGFDSHQVSRIGIRLPARTYAEASTSHRFVTELLEHLPKDPNSQLALMSAFPSYYPANAVNFEIPDGTHGEPPAGVTRVGPSYFELYRVKLEEGREFTFEDRLSSEPVALVSGALARRLWPSGGAVGRAIRVVEGDMPGSPLGPWRTIVGVVGNIRQGYDDSDLRDVYLPFLQVPGRFASIHVRTDQAISFWEQAIRKAAAELDPFVQVTAAKTIVSEDHRGEGTRFLTSLLTGFSIFAALLAALGIYGVTTYSVQQREREIAIRLAIGARRSSITHMFLRDGGRVLALGLAGGLIGGIASVRILRNQIYGIQPFDPLTLLSVMVLMTAVGLFAIWRPARRGAMREPMSVLKES